MKLTKKETIVYYSLLAVGVLPVALMALQTYRFFYTDRGFDWHLNSIITIAVIPGMLSLGIILGRLVPRWIKERNAKREKV